MIIGFWTEATVTPFGGLNLTWDKFDCVFCLFNGKTDHFDVYIVMTMAT